jgi:acetyltransferase
MSLNNFFYPKTIAVVGASQKPEKVGYILMKKLEKFKGEVIPINPNHKTILGKKSYPSLTKCNRAISLAVIATPVKTVDLILEDCGKKEIKNVIIITAGFSEIGNKELESKIIKTAKGYGLNLIGPNCFGIANPEIHLDTTFANSSAKKGKIAFISQSGALWSYISDLDVKEGFSKFVSLGNMADLTFSDFIDYLNKDKKTKKIMLYIEKLKQGKKFIDICKKSKKEIIVIKAGKTKEGSKAAISHTGSLATDFKIYQGAFKQAKIKQVDSLKKALNLKAQKIKFSGKSAIILTNAGGAGALITDYYEENNIKIVCPPIDILGTAQAKDYEIALNELKKRKLYDFLIVIFTPQKMSEPEKTAEAIVKFSKTKKVIAFFLGEKSIKKAKEILERNNVPVFTKI